MRRYPLISRTLAAGLAALMAGGLVSAGTGVASAAPVSSRPAHAGKTAAAAGARRASQPVFLVSGQQMTTASAGSVLAGGAGDAGPLQTLDLGGQRYVVPVQARPYLDQGLAPSLFEPAALAKVEAGGKLPVTVTYAGATPALPGVTITSSSGGTARGYLTPAGARAFGAALARQYAADHGVDGYGRDGLFGGGVSVTLAGNAARARPHRARPDFRMHTLTVLGTAPSGKPDTGDLVNIVDADEASRFWTIGQDSNEFYHGVTKFSVPTGHFLLDGVFTELRGNRYVGTRLDLLPEITVTKNMTVRLSALAADSRVQFVTPRPTVIQAVVFETDYLTYHAPSGCCSEQDDFISFGPVPLYISPLPTPPSVGRFYDVTYAELLSPPTAHGTPYQYALGHESIGTVPPQRYVANQSNLATENSSFYSATPQSGYLTNFPEFPIERMLGTGASVQSITFPQRATMYFTANPEAGWLTQYNQSGKGFGSGGQTGPIQVFLPGQRLADEWGAYPLHPAPNVTPINLSGDINTASATRAGNKLGLSMTTFADNTPGHIGQAIYPPYKATYSYQIDQNGKRIAGGTVNRSYGYFAAKATLSPARSLIKVTLNAAQSASLSPLSPSSQTTWTWWSAHESGSTLPAGWACATAFNRSCAVQPLLTMNYGVVGEQLNGSASPGQQVVRLSIGHFQLAKAPIISNASVSVSFDGGHTWQPAQMTGSGGNYAAVFNAPAGAKVTLRATATDAAGGSITQTITDAYQTTASGGPAAVREACPAAGSQQARCYALYAPQAKVNAAIAARSAGRSVTPGSTTPQGLGAKDIESAYRLPTTRGRGQTVALADAYSTPHLASDLAVYRKEYGLPPCTTASGCLRIVNQDGKASPLPRADPTGWGVEETLDVSMVSAACPLCKIIMVEAKSPTFADLAAAEDTAARLGAQVISNSYGGRESGFTQAEAKAYDHPGHVIVASAGDLGFTAANFPANLASVTAAGGTQLAKAHNARGWTESVWNNNFGSSGSSCSAYVAKPAWQHDPDCLGRTVGDVAALASNVPVYDSSITARQGGPWLTVYGTSAASPLIAGVYALAGNAATVRPGYPYAHPGGLFDVTKGNNDWFTGGHGAVCGYDYLCVAKKGYDAPTGLGTPDGTGAF
jgi:hypothetical protein